MRRRRARRQRSNEVRLMRARPPMSRPAPSGAARVRRRARSAQQGHSTVRCGGLSLRRSIRRCAADAHAADPTSAGGKRQTRGIGDLLDLSCACGYRATDLDKGVLMSGVSDLFTCSRCADVVSAWVGRWPDDPPGSVKATCPQCDGGELEPWGRGTPPRGPCPRCGEMVSTVSVGIAD